VEDNGKGIQPDDIPKIFEPFFTTKNVGEGTGLGLWVSYGIVKSFRGEIRVKRTEGYGTTFTVKLPIQSP
jgi:signal transduction histidine kinase